MILLFLIPVLVLAQTRADTVSFIHISDTHWHNPAGYHPAIIEARQHYAGATDPLVNFFHTIPRKLKSDFVVITGDIIDYWEGESASGDMLETQIEQFITLKSRNAQIPVYLTLGNHDIETYWTDDGRKSIFPAPQLNAGRARAAWIRNSNSLRDGTYYSHTIRVDTTTYRLIFLDNAYYNPDRSDTWPFIMDPYQLYWLDNELKKSDTDIEIIFMHKPLMVPPREDVEASRNTYYLNLEDTLAIQHNLKSFDDDVLDLHNILKKNASTRLVITGHRHASAVHEVHFSDEYSLTHVMTGAFGRDERNWRQIRLTRDSIIISFPGITQKQFVISLE